ncbi:MAG: hypothetical protein J6S57_00690 [Alphaproteobacteria bacterium]|nr:hypothetical protein [Alphaproteobacteria bacterium]
MSNGSSYGKLEVETTFHTLSMGPQSISERGQRILDNMDTISSIKNKISTESKAKTDKWLKKCEGIVSNCLGVMREHLRMMGATDEVITETVAYAKNSDVNNVRYNVLKLLAKHNPEAYNRQCAQYKSIVEKQRG